MFKLFLYINKELSAGLAEIAETTDMTKTTGIQGAIEIRDNSLVGPPQHRIHTTIVLGYCSLICFFVYICISFCFYFFMGCTACQWGGGFPASVRKHSLVEPWVSPQFGKGLERAQTLYLCDASRVLKYPTTSLEIGQK